MCANHTPVCVECVLSVGITCSMSPFVGCTSQSCFRCGISQACAGVLPRQGATCFTRALCALVRGYSSLLRLFLKPTSLSHLLHTSCSRCPGCVACPCPGYELSPCFQSDAPTFTLHTDCAVVKQHLFSCSVAAQWCARMCPISSPQAAVDTATCGSARSHVEPLCLLLGCAFLLGGLLLVS